MSERAAGLRWRLADEDAGDQGTLFSSDDLVRHERGTGRLSGMEFLHVHARRIINEVPAASRMPFRYTSTPTAAAATPARTASPGRRTSTSGSASARTSSARSWSR